MCCVLCLVTQSCLTLCDPMDCSTPGSSVHGILQARILEWVAMPFSKRSSQPRDWTQVSCIVGVFFTVWATREARLAAKYLWFNISFMKYNWLLCPKGDIKFAMGHFCQTFPSYGAAVVAGDCSSGQKLYCPCNWEWFRVTPFCSTSQGVSAPNNCTGLSRLSLLVRLHTAVLAAEFPVGLAEAFVITTSEPNFSFSRIPGSGRPPGGGHGNPL